MIIDNLYEQDDSLILFQLYWFKIKRSYYLSAVIDLDLNSDQNTHC